MSFASMMDGSFGYDFGGGMPKKLANAKDEFTEHLCSRLDFVTIENRDALEVISTYDNDKAFHFVDPPYINSDCGHYEGCFNEQNMEALLQLLETVKGKFMLTMFPLPLIEKYAIKNGWIIHRIERTISASKTNRRKQEEWMVLPKSYFGTESTSIHLLLIHYCENPFHCLFHCIYYLESIQINTNVFILLLIYLFMNTNVFMFASCS